MKRGRRSKARDDGAVLPSSPPACLSSEAEKKAYTRIHGHLSRVGHVKASDIETVCVASRRLARLEMLQEKYQIIMAQDQLIIGTATEATP